MMTRNCCRTNRMYSWLAMNLAIRITCQCHLCRTSSGCIETRYRPGWYCFQFGTMLCCEGEVDECTWRVWEDDVVTHLQIADCGMRTINKPHLNNQAMLYVHIRKWVMLRSFLFPIKVMALAALVFSLCYHNAQDSRSDLCIKMTNY